MDISDVRDWVKAAVAPPGCWVGAHKMDLSRETGVCVYRRKGVLRRAVGGAAGYRVLPVTMLIRGGTEAARAARLADEVYEGARLAEAPGGYAMMAQDAAVALGTDEKGVYEFTVDFDIYLAVEDEGEGL